MDNLVFEEAVNAEITDSEFISKKWVYVNDNNSQNYTSQVIIDTTPLANAGGYVNWSEGYIMMPLVVSLTTDTGQSTGLLPLNNDNADWSWAFKNGFWQMINSMTVEFNNQNIVQQTPFLNVFRSFKNQTSMSEGDVKNNGAGIGFAMDSADSWQYTTDPATRASFTPTTGVTVPNNPVIAVNYPRASGGGLSNNIDWGYEVNYYPPTASTNLNYTQTPIVKASPVAGVPFAGASTGGSGTSGGTAGTYAQAGGASSISAYQAFNEGMYQRQKAINLDPYNNSGASNAYNGWNGQGIVMPPSAFSANYISGRIQQTVAGCVSWNVYAKLRLKDLADYFNKVPLLKGSTMRFYINTNQAITNFTIDNGSFAAIGTGEILNLRQLTVNSASVNGGLTCPLMLTSPLPCSGGSPLPAGTYNLSVSIYKNNNTVQTAIQSATTSLTACRLYAPVYKFNPLAEQRYLSLTPTKRVEYNDVFQYQFQSINAGANFNFLVTNGLPNIQSVLVVPFINSQANQVKTGVYLSTLLSPTTTSGGTPDPIPLSNFNILVSGVNLFLNNEQYDFEALNQELLGSNQLNGNLTTGLTSGLIDQENFTKLYRWYYGNCARVLPSEEGVSRSIQIQGQNNSGVTIDLMVFVEFKKSMTIDISTGARIE